MIKKNAMVTKSVLEERMNNLIKSNDEGHRIISEQVECINQKLDTRFVTQDQFGPIQKIVYGLVGLILTAVAVAFLTVILDKPL